MLHKSVPGRICGSSLSPDGVGGSCWQCSAQAGPVLITKRDKFVFGSSGRGRCFRSQSPELLSESLLEGGTLSRPSRGQVDLGLGALGRGLSHFMELEPPKPSVGTLGILEKTVHTLFGVVCVLCLSWLLSLHASQKSV